MSENPNAVVTELYNVLNTSATLVGLSEFGLSHTFNQLASVTPHPDNPDPLISVGSGKPDEPGASQHAGLRLSALVPLIEVGGAGHALLHQMWVIYAYEAWQQEYRPRLAAARGVDLSEVTHPYFGDLRLLRHDAVHRAGRASRRNTGRCELFVGWFADDELISFSQAQWVSLLGALFPWDALIADPVR